jgi:hypothetical protein
MPDRLANLSDRDLLIMNTEDTKNLLLRVNQIDDRLRTLNGNVSDTMIKLAKTEEIAKTAEETADCNDRRIDTWVRATIVAAVGAIAAIVASIILIVRTKT